MLDDGKWLQLCRTALSRSWAQGLKVPGLFIYAGEICKWIQRNKLVFFLFSDYFTCFHSCSVLRDSEFCCCWTFQLWLHHCWTPRDRVWNIRMLQFRGNLSNFTWFFNDYFFKQVTGLHIFSHLAAPPSDWKINIFSIYLSSMQVSSSNYHKLPHTVFPTRHDSLHHVFSFFSLSSFGPKDNINMYFKKKKISYFIY